MKLNFFSTFHYIVLFALIILVSPMKRLGECGIDRIVQERPFTQVEKMKDKPVAKENTTDVLHSELLFKY